MSEMTPREAADDVEFLINAGGSLVGMAGDLRSVLSPQAQAALDVLIDHARATAPASPVHLDDEDFGRFGDPIPCGAPVAHDEQGTPTAWCKRPTVPGHRCDLRVASTSRNALRGRLYAAFIEAEICKIGFSLLDRYRRPDAPEAERMADVALTAFRDAAPEREVMSATEADALPPGSIIRFGRSWYPLTMDDGRWRATPADRYGYTLSRGQRVEVLARGVSVENGGSGPASPAAIGDVIEDEAALDRLPDGTALRGHDGRVLQKARFSADEVLWEPGEDVALDCHLALPARVIDLPAPEQPTDSAGGVS